MSQARAAILVLSVVLGSTAFMPARGDVPEPAFEESWDAPSWADPFPPGWTASGPSAFMLGCGGDLGCYLSSDPTSSTLSHLRRDVSSSLADGLVASFRFQATDTTGPRDALLQIGFNVGHLHMDVTEGDNNAAALQTTGAPKLLAGHWTETNAWYTVQAIVDPASMSATMTLTDPAGELIGTAGPTPLPTGATRLAYVDFQAASYGQGPVVLLDDLVIATGDARILLEETFGMPDGWIVTGAGAQDCGTGVPPCSIAIDATCCAALSYVSRAVAAPEGPLRVDVSFKTSAVGTDSDATFEVRFENADIHLALTEGWDSDEVWLRGPDGSSSLVGAISPDVWYHAIVVIERATGLVFAQIHAEGTPPGAFNAARVVPDLGELVSVRHHSVQWTPDSSATYHFDSLRITPAGRLLAEAGAVSYSFDVPATGETVVRQVPEGQYLVRASGTYAYGTGLSNAQCHTVPHEVYWGNHHADPILDLLIDEGELPWAPACDPVLHTYETPYTCAREICTIAFRIHDLGKIPYEDNEGSLRVDIEGARVVL